MEADVSACFNHVCFAARSSVSPQRAIDNLFRHFFVICALLVFFVYFFQRRALKALESIHASGRLVSRSDECVQPLTQVCRKPPKKGKRKLHAEAFTSRSAKPRLASYWEAVWLIRRRLVQSGRSAETWGAGGCFTSKQGEERYVGKPAHAAPQDREESSRRCHTLKGIFNRDLFAPLASLYRNKKIKKLNKYKRYVGSALFAI